MFVQKPGSASVDTTTTIRQFPHRDGAVMADTEGMNEPGWSNSNHEPEADVVDEKVVADDSVEDKAVKTPAKKTTARKKA